MKLLKSSLRPPGSPGAIRSAGDRVLDLSLAVLFVVGVLALATTVAGFFGRSWWAFDLVSHFRVQLVVTLALAGAGFLLRGDRLIPGLFGVGAAVNFALLLPFLVPRFPAPSGVPIRVGVINLDIYNEQPELVPAEIRRRDPDVVVLLEYDDAWAARLAEVREAFSGVKEAPRGSPFGIAVFSRAPFLEVQELQLVPDAGPAISARLEAGGGELEVLAFHPFPPLRENGTALRDRELEAAAAFVRSRDAPTIVMGDLNVTYWSHAYRDLTDGAGLLSAAVGNGLRGTWPTDLPPLRIPIDHILLTEELVAVEFDRGAFVGSDHFPVWAEVGWSG